MAASSQAGIVSAIGILALLMTAIAALITSLATRRTSLATQRAQLRTEIKVDAGNAQGVETHKLVNQRFTDLEKYVIALQRQIRADGGTPVEDQSKGEDQPA